jgi:hypothetical protein
MAGILSRLGKLVPDFKPFRPPSNKPAVVLNRRPRPDQDEKIPARAGAALNSRQFFLPYAENTSTGDTPEIRAAMRKMLRDPYVKSGWLTQVLTVLSQPFQVHTPKGDKSKDALKQTDWIRHCVDKADGGLVGLGSAILMNMGSDGFTLSEKVWETVPRGEFAGNMRLRVLKPKGKFDSEFTLIGDGYNNITGVRSNIKGITYPISDFVYQRYMHTFDEPHGMAAFRASYGGYWSRDTVRKLRIMHKEKGLDGLLKGTFSDPSDKGPLEDALAAVRESTWIAIPEGVQVEMMQKSQANDSDYKSFDESLREEILVGIAFAHLHILQGQSSGDARGNTTVHKAVADLGPWLLTYLVQIAINNQIIPDLIDFNFPMCTDYPTITLGGVTNDEILQMLQVLDGAQRAGFKPSRNYYGTELTIQEADPEDPTDTLTPPAPSGGGGFPMPGMPGADPSAAGGAPAPDPFGAPAPKSPDQFGAELSSPPGGEGGNDGLNNLGALTFSDGDSFQTFGWFTGENGGKYYVRKNGNPQNPSDRLYGDAGTQAAAAELHGPSGGSIRRAATAAFDGNAPVTSKNFAGDPHAGVLAAHYITLPVGRPDGGKRQIYAQDRPDGFLELEFDHTPIGSSRANLKKSNPELQGGSIDMLRGIQKLVQHLAAEKKPIAYSPADRRRERIYEGVMLKAGYIPVATKDTVNDHQMVYWRHSADVPQPHDAKIAAYRAAMAKMNIPDRMSESTLSFMSECVAGGAFEIFGWDEWTQIEGGKWKSPGGRVLGDPTFQRLKSKQKDSPAAKPETEAPSVKQAPAGVDEHKWNAAKQKEYKAHDRALTKVLTRGNPNEIIATAKEALGRFEQIGYPDQWSRWQRAIDDAEHQKRLKPDNFPWDDLGKHAGKTSEQLASRLKEVRTEMEFNDSPAVMAKLNTERMALNHLLSQAVAVVKAPTPAAPYRSTKAEKDTAADVAGDAAFDAYWKATAPKNFNPGPTKPARDTTQHQLPANTNPVRIVAGKKDTAAVIAPFVKILDGLSTVKKSGFDDFAKAAEQTLKGLDSLSMGDLRKVAHAVGVPKSGKGNNDYKPQPMTSVSGIKSNVRSWIKYRMNAMGRASYFSEFLDSDPFDAFAWADWKPQGDNMVSPGGRVLSRPVWERLKSDNDAGEGPGDGEGPTVEQVIRGDRAPTRMNSGPQYAPHQLAKIHESAIIDLEEVADSYPTDILFHKKGDPTGGISIRDYIVNEHIKQGWNKSTVGMPAELQTRTHEQLRDVLAHPEDPDRTKSAMRSMVEWIGKLGVKAGAMVIKGLLRFAKWSVSKVAAGLYNAFIKPPLDTLKQVGRTVPTILKWSAKMLACGAALAAVGAVPALLPAAVGVKIALSIPVAAGISAVIFKGIRPAVDHLGNEVNNAWMGYPAGTKPDEKYNTEPAVDYIVPGEPSRPFKPGGLFSERGGARSLSVIQKFADPPTVGHTIDDVALAGKDGKRAAELMAGALKAGRSVLAGNIEKAVNRLLAEKNPLAATTLFDDAELKEVQDSLSAVNATADLLGRSRLRSKAEYYKKAEKFAEGDNPNEPDPFAMFAEVPPLQQPNLAADYFRKLVPTLAVDPRRYAPYFDRYAFTLAHATDTVVLGKIQAIIADQLANGKRPHAVQDIADELDAAGLTHRNPQYPDMVYRTNMMDSYVQGHDAEMKDPHMQEEFPAWRYLGIHDSRAGEDHIPKFDRFYPSTATFAEVRGDRVFNCRCGAEPIHRLQWRKLMERGARYETTW